MGKTLKEKLKGELNEFKDFAMKGDAITLAVGVVIGVAFKDLVDSLVNNVFTPPIGFLTAKLDFSKLFITLGKGDFDTLEEALAADAVVIQYGLVLNAIITFTITAIILYFIVRAMSKAAKKEEKKEAKTTKTCPYCMSDINIKAKKCPFCTSVVK
ncbi:MAG: Large-conductance mechanosensitive channel [candidate division WS6 bacterium GW2011_GWE1_34_7]|uniref:Large-conductance mechanosensitive channel n=1 Tax=candidate division WS6 bacterium GW2011_GWE1_34_7 TaxID=1619093 RepID=A0A0G0BJA5_9BACT|nr:MAG: Large-conductance mechanosensitive channel [candidate division WS6 bacterium GW2011_GWE1_34_7]